MTVTTENSIRELLSNSEEMILSELNLIKNTLEKLFESDEARIPKEELFNDRVKICEVSQRIVEAKDLRQKSDIYYVDFRPLFNALKAKYSDFLSGDIFKQIDDYEKYIDGLMELIGVHDMMSSAFEEKIDKVQQYERLYKGMVKLSELLEEYLLYFSQDLIEAVKNLAFAFLNASSLKPDKTNQNESDFSSLVALKNTARAVLWQIEENRTKMEKPPLIGSTSSSLTLTPEMQIQKNQAAMDWAKSRLEEIKSIEAKGWKL